MSLGVRNAEIIPFEPEQDNTCARESANKRINFYLCAPTDSMLVRKMECKISYFSCLNRDHHGCDLHLWL